MTNVEIRMMKGARIPRGERACGPVLPSSFGFSAPGRKFGDVSVAQVSKPAVSRISKSASALTKDGLPTGKSAIQQVWKPALRHRICARLHLVEMALCALLLCNAAGAQVPAPPPPIDADDAAFD